MINLSHIFMHKFDLTRFASGDGGCVQREVNEWANPFVSRSLSGHS
jgi:hypothetical protein